MEEKKEKKVDFLLAERLEAAAARLEEANAKADSLMKAQEEMRSRELLGGQSLAAPAPVKKEETPKEYKDRIMRGGI